MNRLFLKVKKLFQHNFYKALKRTYFEFLITTKLSGVWLLNEQFNKGKSRWLWYHVLLLLLGTSVYLTLLQWINYYSYPIVTSLSDKVSISEIPFPAITICGSDMDRIDLQTNFLKTLKLLPQYKKAELLAGMPFLLSYIKDLKLKGKGLNKTFNTEPLHKVLEYNNITVDKAMSRILPDCRDLVKYCFWGERSFPCVHEKNPFSFESVNTIFGQCCTMAGNNRHLSVYPNIFGMEGGLTLIGPAFNVILIIHHRKEVLAEWSKRLALYKNAMTYTNIMAQSHKVSDPVLNLAASKRKCLHGTDVGLLEYRWSICVKNCQMNIYKDECGCIPYHLSANTTKTRECNLKDLKCFWHVLGKYTL